MVRTVPKSIPAVPLTEEELKEVFKRHDINGDGRLDEDELKNAFKTFGSRYPAWRVSRGLHHADNNGDGCINITDAEMDDLVNYTSKLGYTLVSREGQ